VPDREVCGNCEGTGEADCPLEWGGDCPENCPACGGDQIITCTVCGGSGYED